MNESRPSAPIVELIFSPTGGTQRVTDLLAKRLASGAAIRTIDLCDRDAAGRRETLQGDELAMIAVPSYGGRVPALALERLAQIDGHGALAVLVCVYGNRAYDDTLSELLDAAQKDGFRAVAAVAALAEHSVARQVAAGRPDADDAVRLQAMADQIAAKLASGDTTPPAVPGRVPEKRPHGPGMAPGVTDACVKCGLCADRCPTAAIDATTFRADSKTCISCMRCIAVCPANARKLNMVITSLGGVALSLLCRERKECELYL